MCVTGVTHWLLAELGMDGWMDNTHIASITTATPAGSSASEMAEAICLVKRSWTRAQNKANVTHEQQTKLSRETGSLTLKPPAVNFNNSGKMKGEESKQNLLCVFVCIWGAAFTYLASLLRPTTFLFGR